MVRAAMDVGSDLAHLAAVRESIVDQATAWGVPTEGGVLALLVSELLANAIEHGAPPIKVALDWDDRRLRVEIRDASTEVPVHRVPAVGDPDGRGIWLVDRNASDWGIERLPDGKAVWFELRHH